VFLCVFLTYDQFVYFVYCVLGAFSPVYFELLVPVQVIAWKDSVSEMTINVSSGTQNSTLSQSWDVILFIQQNELPPVLLHPSIHPSIHLYVE